MIKKVLERINSKPRNLLLIDGLGALISSFFLGVILVEFEQFFGIPSATLYILALIPCFFIIYDLYGYRKGDENLGGFLKGIAVMNLLYCGLSIGMAVYHRQQIKIFGWTYLLLEIIIIINLAIFELKTARRINTNK